MYANGSTRSQRKDTLKRLIDLAHSPHPSLKVIAATNVKLFIRDFPELEDDAINAVYDLCEDPVSSVRLVACFRIRHLVEQYSGCRFASRGMLP